MIEIKRILPIIIRLTKNKLREFNNRLLSDNTYKHNVFHKSYTKKALLYYLPNAFNRKGIPKFHANLTESYTIGEAFDQLGYIVDCITAGSSKKINYEQYDVILATGMPIHEILRQKKRPKLIFYAPGAHPFYSLDATAKKNLSVYEQKGVWLTKSSRYIDPNAMGVYLSLFTDHVIILGNEWSLKQYTKWDSQRPSHYSVLKAFYFDCHQPNFDNKDYKTSCSHILWFGSMGLIHKGLDIALDIAIKHPEITLHICGAPKREKDFWNYYSPLIKDCKNIVDHGFVNIESDQFVEIMNQCSFLIMPSISEGCSTSILNVVANGGLIPIYSSICGVDLQPIGISIPSITYDAFEAAVLDAIRIQPDEIKKQSIQICELVRNNYTLEQYRNNLKEIISKI